MSSRIACLGVVAAVVLSGCGANGKASSPQTKKASIPAQVGAPSLRPTPLAQVGKTAATPQSAVEMFIGGLIAHNPNVTYGLLSEKEQATITPAGWAGSLSTLPQYEGFSIVRSDPVDVEATFVPKLDEANGLIPRHALVHFATIAESGGWRVSLARTTVEPHYPTDDAGASEVALDWAKDRQVCEATNSTLQYAGSLLGQPPEAKNLCRWAGTITVSGRGKLSASQSATAVRNAFGPTADDWARVIQVNGPNPLDVVVAPFGDTWRVVAVNRK